MARTEKTLTLEEKLAQALVPDTEQLYPVPDNWCWVTASSLASVISKGTTPQGGKHAYSDTGISFLRVENILDDGTISHDKIMHVSEGMHSGFLKRSVLQEGDILVSIAGTLGKTAVVRNNDLPINTNQAVSFIRLKHKGINRKYVKFAIDTPIIQSYLLLQTKVTAIPNLTLEIIRNCPIPLAPLAEQQRIVDRTESLFAKLDEAQEKAQAVVDGFEDRKAAILHKAFTGELTAEWREKNGIDYFDTWEKRNLGDFASSQYGYTEKSSSEKIGPKFLRITDIQDGQVIWKEVPYCKIDEELKEKYSLKIGDIVVARTGATTGKSYMVIDEIDAVYASYLIRVSIEKKELLRSKYLYYFLQCPLYWRQITELSSGIAQPGVNGNKLKTLQLPIPIVDEQDRIVELLDHLLPVERQVRDSAELVIDQIDAMKKSILARAFRGELGTNDPTDETAIELLTAVLCEEQDTEHVQRSGKIKTYIPKKIDAQLSTGMERDIIKVILAADNNLVSLETVMAVSSKKFDVLDTLRTLEKKGVIQKDIDGNYKIIILE